MPAVSYSPILRPAKIKDIPGDPTTGDHLSWVDKTNPADLAPNPGINAYSLILTNKEAVDSADPNINTTPVGHLQAEKIWNSVWNDYADLQLLCDEYIAGKCYFDTADGAKICSEQCQLSVMGLATDTFAQVVGKRSDQKQIPIAVAGWALAFVDKEYPCGTPLTNNSEGDLTEMTLQEKRDYPERLVGIYKKKELDAEFGPAHSKIKVNGRHWVKVK
jgi:hypothetical protein